MRMMQAKDLKRDDVIAFKGERQTVLTVANSGQNVIIRTQTYLATLTINTDPDYEFRVVGGGREHGND